MPNNFSAYSRPGPSRMAAGAVGIANGHGIDTEAHHHNGNGHAEIPPQIPEERPDPPRELLTEAIRRDSAHATFGQGFSSNICLEIGGDNGDASILDDAQLPSGILRFLVRRGTSFSGPSSPVQSDRVQCFLPRLSNKVDLMLLSPDSNDMNERILSLIARFLSPRGRYYLLLSAEDKPIELCRQMGRKGLASREVMSRPVGEREHIFSVFCFTHK